jgi:hypothetical protein
MVRDANGTTLGLYDDEAVLYQVGGVWLRTGIKRTGVVIDSATTVKGYWPVTYYTSVDCSGTPRIGISDPPPDPIVRDAVVLVNRAYYVGIPEHVAIQSRYSSGSCAPDTFNNIIPTHAIESVDAAFLVSAAVPLSVASN